MPRRLLRNGALALSSILLAAGSQSPASSRAANGPDDTLTIQTLLETWSLGRMYDYRIRNTGGPVYMSPDGRRVAFVLYRDDVSGNEQIGKLIVFELSETKRAKITFETEYRSGSNHLPAWNLRWSDSGRKLYFIAASDSASPAQLQELDVASTHVRQLTSSLTHVTGYSTPEPAGFAYVAERPWKSLWSSDRNDVAHVIEDENFVDLITGRDGRRFRGPDDESELFFSDGSTVKKFRTTYNIARAPQRPVVSANGRFIAVRSQLPSREIDARWPAAYPGIGDTLFTISAQTDRRESVFEVLEILDRETGVSRVPVKAPLGSWGFTPPVRIGDDEIAFSSYIPVDWKGFGSVRRPTTLALQMGNGKVVHLDACGAPQHWDVVLQQLLCKAAPSSGPEAPNRAFRKLRSGWAAVPGNVRTPTMPFTVRIDQHFDRTPRLMVAGASDGGSQVLWDLAPDWPLTRSEELNFPAAAGDSEFAGGLFYPEPYRAGKRYPLVIQTHGWDATEYVPTGYGGAGYAARLLAKRGMFVLQLADMPRSRADGDSLKEVQTALGRYGRVINDLEARGLIDPKRVGVIGWSRTSFYVKYALTNSNLFAVASVAEGEDGGYLQYVTRFNEYVDPGSMYGGSPFSPAMAQWAERAPGFNLTKVKAPLQISALNPRFLLGEWEFFTGLRELGKPVRMELYRDGSHYLEKPQEKLRAISSNLEWFSFWLNSGAQHQQLNPASAKYLNDMRVRYCGTVDGMGSTVCSTYP